LADAARILTEAGIDAARRESRLLLAHVLSIDSASLLGRSEACLSGEDARRFDELVARRRQREPISRIVGRREFWSLSFALGPTVLDPRPDSETLISAMLEALPNRKAPLRVLDLGTGSGCLLLALLSELPNARGVGVDIDLDALDVARANALALGLSDRAAFQAGNWGAGLDRGFDVIVSNPPYIPDGDIDRLEPEVSIWDPRRALAGGVDGLDCIRLLAPQLVTLLAGSGMAAIEFGQGQSQAVEFILKTAGLRVQRTVRDLSGLARCVFATVGRE
jgi:release factor glutamine methyltransferase